MCSGSNAAEVQVRPCAKSRPEQAPCGRRPTRQLLSRVMLLPAMLLGSLYVFVYWGLAESLMNEQAQTEQMTLSRHGHASWSPMLLMASASESNQPKPEARPSKGSQGIETHRAPQGRSQSKGGRFQVPIKRDLEETAYNSSRAVVMCAYSRHTLCQAYTQIEALTELLLENGDLLPDFLILHANELYRDIHITQTTDTPAGNSQAGATPEKQPVYKYDVHYLVKKLESPHVKIQSLEPWLLRNFDNSTTPEDRRRHLTKIQRQYRGYFCKPAAMLAALDEGYKVVALVDLDTVLVQSPFELESTAVFQEMGAYLFRDRHNPYLPPTRPPPAAPAVGKTAAPLPPLPPPYPLLSDNVTRAWRMLHPHSPELPPHLADTDLLTGITTDYGESALVLWANDDRTAAARQTLRMLIHPDKLPHWWFGWGDKEYFWLSFALAGPRPEVLMNPYMPSNIGVKTGKGQPCSKGGMVQFVPCNYRMRCYNSTDQVVSTVNATLAARGNMPRTFYLNGDDVESLFNTPDRYIERRLDETFVARVATVPEGDIYFCSHNGFLVTPDMRRNIKIYQQANAQCRRLPLRSLSG